MGGYGGMGHVLEKTWREEFEGNFLIYNISVYLGQWDVSLDPI